MAPSNKRVYTILALMLAVFNTLSVASRCMLMREPEKCLANELSTEQACLCKQNTLSQAFVAAVDNNKCCRSFICNREAEPDDPSSPQLSERALQPGYTSSSASDGLELDVRDYPCEGLCTEPRELILRQGLRYLACSVRGTIAACLRKNARSDPDVLGCICEHRNADAGLSCLAQQFYPSRDIPSCAAGYGQFERSLESYVNPYTGDVAVLDPESTQNLDSIPFILHPDGNIDYLTLNNGKRIRGAPLPYYEYLETTESQRTYWKCYVLPINGALECYATLVESDTPDLPTNTALPSHGYAGTSRITGSSTPTSFNADVPTPMAAETSTVPSGTMASGTSLPAADVEDTASGSQSPGPTKTAKGGAISLRPRLIYATFVFGVISFIAKF